MAVAQEFRDLVREHQGRTGFEMPLQLENYIVDLLAQRLEQTEIIPHPSFAECYLRLYQRPSVSAMRVFADQCLFFVSLMPDYGHRRGLNMDYYATLGISAYYAAGDLAPDPRFTQLGNWFYHLQRFLNTALHPDRRLELFIFNLD